MNHLDRTAGIGLFLLAVTAASAPVEAKNPALPGPTIPKDALEPVPLPPPPPQPPPTQNPPESNGWPHDIVSGYSTSCGREPGPNEVIVYKDRGFGGKCALLKPGFYLLGEGRQRRAPAGL